MSGTREQLRAIFLAFVMITSVVALAAPASASSGTNDNAASQTVSPSANQIEVMNFTLDSEDVALRNDPSPGTAASSNPDGDTYYADNDSDTTYDSAESTQASGSNDGSEELIIESTGNNDFDPSDDIIASGAAPISDFSSDDYFIDAANHDGQYDGSTGAGSELIINTSAGTSGEIDETTDIKKFSGTASDANLTDFSDDTLGTNGNVNIAGDATNDGSYGVSEDIIYVENDSTEGFDADEDIVISNVTSIADVASGDSYPLDGGYNLSYIDLDGDNTYDFNKGSGAEPIVRASSGSVDQSKLFAKPAFDSSNSQGINDNYFENVVSDSGTDGTGDDLTSLAGQGSSGDVGYIDDDSSAGYDGADDFDEDIVQFDDATFESGDFVTDGSGSIISDSAFSNSWGSIQTDTSDLTSSAILIEDNDPTDSTSGESGAIGAAVNTVYGDELIALTVTNDGSVPTGDIQTVKLYKDTDSTPGLSSSDQLLTQTGSTNSLGQYELDVANSQESRAVFGNESSGSDSARFMIAVDLDGASNGDDLQLTVPSLFDNDGNGDFDSGTDAGLFLESDESQANIPNPDGGSPGPITNANSQTVQVTVSNLPGDGDGSIDTSINSSGDQDIIAGSNDQDLGTIRVRDVDTQESVIATQTVLTMPSGVTINSSATNVIASGGGSLSVSDTSVSSDGTQLTINHDAASSAGDTLKISGVSVDVATDISASESGTDNAINVQYSSGNFDSNLLSAHTPGSTSAQITPGIGATDVGLSSVNIDTAGINGQIASGSDIVIGIPSNNGVTFNTSTLATSYTRDVDSDSSNELDAVSATTNASKSVTIPVTDDVGAGSTISVGGLRVDLSPSASNTNLTVTTEPINSAGTITNETDAPSNQYVVAVNAPTLRTNADGAGSGADLTIANDGDAETQIDPDGEGGQAEEITITSGANDDIASTTAGTNITVSIPSDAAFTFDQSSDPSSGVTQNGGNALNVVNDVLVDDRTLNLTLDQTAASSGVEAVTVSNVQFNTTAGEESVTQLTADINRTGVSVTSENDINVTQATVDSVSASAVGGTNGEVGSTQTFTVSATNTSFSTSNTDIPLDNTGAFGGADISLEANGTPSGVATSDVTFNVSGNTVTTAEDSSAGVNVTLANKAGKYNITATSPDDNAVNATVKYTASAGAASQFNVTQVDNALVDDSGLNTPSEAEVAAYRVRVEDSGGNVNNSAAVDVGVSLTGDAELAGDRPNGLGSNFAGLATEINNGDPSGEVINDTNNNGRYNYDASGSSDSPSSSDDGIFYVFVSDQTAEDVDLTVSQSGVSDTATTTVYDNVDNVDVAFNTTGTVNNGSGVAATATIETNGSAIEVPRVDVDFNSTNTTVASSADTAFPTTVPTEDDGTALVNVSADAEGSADITATSQNVEGSNTLNVGNLSANFTLSNLNAPSTVTQNQSYTVTADVSNEGSAAGTQDVDYTFASVSETKSVQLDAGNSTSVEFNLTASDTNNTATGNYTHTVATSGASDLTQDAEVVAPSQATADFGVSDLSAPATVNVSEDLTVNATITNNGGAEGTQNITFRISNSTPLTDDDVLDSVTKTDVTLASGASQDVSFDVTAPSTNDTYTHGVFTDDANQTATLDVTVEEDAPAYYTLKFPNSIADRGVQTTTISTFSTHRQSGSTALLPHSVYRYTRTHTGGLR